jgi:hypothetical protein
MRKMTDEEAEEKVISFLRERGRMTSFEIDSHFKDRDEECPDALVTFLARMKRKGKIKGEVSKERRGWVWWAD